MKETAARACCPACHGSGQVSFFQGVSRFLLTWEECPECAGLGYVLDDDDGDRARRGTGDGAGSGGTEAGRQQQRE